jgi:anti-sigma B factor antagonist
MSRQVHDIPEPAGPVRVEVERGAGDRCVVHLGGQLVSDYCGPVRRVVAGELFRAPALLALDVAGVTGIDSAGVDALTSAATQAGECDIAFCLVGADRGPVAGALAHAHLTDLFEIAATLEDI